MENSSFETVHEPASSRSVKVAISLSRSRYRIAIWRNASASDGVLHRTLELAPAVARLIALARRFADSVLASATSSSPPLLSGAGAGATTAAAWASAERVLTREGSAASGWFGWS